MPNSENKSPEKSESLNILTIDDIMELEKNNIIKALNVTNWRISGEGGAAQLLNLPRTTLTSKIKKFGIKQVAIG